MFPPGRARLATRPVATVPPREVERRRPENKSDVLAVHTWPRGLSGRTGGHERPAYPAEVAASSSVTPPSRLTGPPPRVVYGEGHSRPAQPHGNSISIVHRVHRRPARANCVAVAASSVTNVAPARSPMARTIPDPTEHIPGSSKRPARSRSSRTSREAD